MKDYFSHDYNARNDKKLVKVAMKHGMTGIGTFWCISEMLYEENGQLAITECERIAYELRIDKELILSILNDFDLFKIKNGVFFSESIARRLMLRREKSEKARQSATARWGSREEDDANASGTDSEGSADGEDPQDEPKPKKAFGENSIEYKAAGMLYSLICTNYPTHKFNALSNIRREKQLQGFAKEADMILRVDKRDPKLFKFIVGWSQTNDFWKGNILSMGKLREKFDTLVAQAKTDYDKQKKQDEKNKFPANHSAE